MADENCSATLMAMLREAGHDVKYIRDIAPGLDDETIFALARSEARLLLTYDRDFGRIAEHVKDRPPAVLLMRLHGLPAETNAAIVLQAIVELGDALLGHVVVIGHAGFRARPYKN